MEYLLNFTNIKKDLTSSCRFQLCAAPMILIKPALQSTPQFTAHEPFTSVILFFSSSDHSTKTSSFDIWYDIACCN